MNYKLSNLLGSENNKINENICLNVFNKRKSFENFPISNQNVSHNLQAKSMFLTNTCSENYSNLIMSKNSNILNRKEYSHSNLSLPNNCLNSEKTTSAKKLSCFEQFVQNLIFRNCNDIKFTEIGDKNSSLFFNSLSISFLLKTISENNSDSS